MNAVPGHPHRSIADVVLGVPSPRPPANAVVFAWAGLGAAALLALWGMRVTPRPDRRQQTPRWAPLEISLDEPVPPTSSPATPSARHDPVPAPKRSAPHTSRPSAARPTQAAAIVAREPLAPVDLTGETFVVGEARAFVGGSTSPRGTAAIPAQASERSAGPQPAEDGGRRGRSLPVGLASQNWSCPWPSEADPLPIDEETVVIRVVVRPDGSAESVTVISDPGHGFGEAAAACARRTQFGPARTSDGQPVRAQSAPIRVRFTR